MDMQIRLTASDLQENGVFDALRTLCTCFGGDRFAKITPPAEKDKPDAPAVTSKPQKAVHTAPTQQPSAASVPTAASNVPPMPVAAPPTAASNVPPMPVAAPPTVTSNVPPVPVTAPPTASASFTGLQVAQAAAAYAETSDTARQNVVNLIHSFGAHTLNEIPSDRLGEFATGLRGLGRVSDAGHTRKNIQPVKLL